MFLAQTTPDSWFELIMLPGLATFFGLLTFFLSSLKERDGGKAPAKWIGLALCVIGVIIGFGPFWLYISSSADSAIYRELVSGRKMMIGHMGGFILPLAGALTCVAYHFFIKRKNRFLHE